MRRLFTFICVFTLLSGCTTQGSSYRTLAGQTPKTYKQCQELGRQAMEHAMSRLQSIQKASHAGGFVTVEELDELRAGLIPDWGKCYINNPNHREYADLYNCLNKGKDATTCKKFYTEYTSFLREVVGEDMLPFKAMFFLALEEENYANAETIRKEWLKELSALKGGSFRMVFSQKFEDILAGMPMRRLEQQIAQLNSVVGLTDPVLIRLRKKLIAVTDTDNWDAAQKIQHVMTVRANELRLKRPQVMVQGPSSGGSNITIENHPSSVQNPAAQQKVPRYDATDVIRALKAMDGKTVTQKEAETAKMMGIIFGRS